MPLKIGIGYEKENEVNLSDKHQIAVKHPEIGYTEGLIHLTVAGTVNQDKQVDLALCLVIKPYRTLPDGAIEYAPDKDHIRIADGNAKTNPKKPAIGQLAQDVEAAIERALQHL